MKHIIAAAVTALVIMTGIVLYKTDFHYGNFNEETKTLYAFFLGACCTLIIVTAMAIIYNKKAETEEEYYNTSEEEEMNEIYRHREKFPAGCMGFVVGFIALVTYTLYVSITYL